MKTVEKDAPGIEYYWGGVDIAPGRGEIHLNIIAIGKDKAYLEAFYKATTTEEKAKVIEKYAKDKLDMTADINPFNQNPKYFASSARQGTSALGARL